MMRMMMTLMEGDDHNDDENVTDDHADYDEDDG